MESQRSTWAQKLPKSSAELRTQHHSGLASSLKLSPRKWINSDLGQRETQSDLAELGPGQPRVLHLAKAAGTLPEKMFKACTEASELVETSVMKGTPLLYLKRNTKERGSVFFPTLDLFFNLGCLLSDLGLLWCCQGVSVFLECILSQLWVIHQCWCV